MLDLPGRFGSSRPPESYRDVLRDEQENVQPIGQIGQQAIEFIRPRACLCASIAAAQPVQEWNVTVQQTSGNVQMCPSGNRGGKVQVKDGIMTLSFPGGYPGPFWTAKLAADGSFDAVVESPIFRGGTRVTVPAGTGPREIKTMRQTQVCGYRMIPD